jgi:hypothetical protein
MNTGYETPGSLSGSLSNRGSQHTSANQQGQVGNPGNDSRPPDLFHNSVRAGKRTYFFDVRQSSSGSLYLTLCESRPNEGGSYDRSRIMVFQDCLPGFVQALGKALEFIDKSSGQTTQPRP